MQKFYIRKIFNKITIKFLRLKYKLYLLFLRMRGANIASSVKCFGFFHISGDPSNLTIGDYSTINEGVHLNCRDTLIIGKHVHISPKVQIHTGGLILEKFPRIHYSKPVIIEDNVWIASGAIINPGVRIGKNSVILPASVVIHDVPPNTIVGGIPAKVIKTLGSNK